MMARLCSFWITVEGLGALGWKSHHYEYPELSEAFFGGSGNKKASSDEDSSVTFTECLQSGISVGTMEVKSLVHWNS